jgi:hypothetical protein
MNALTEGTIDVFAPKRAEHTVTVYVYAFWPSHWSGEKRASAEPRDGHRSIRRAAAIDDEKAISLHLPVWPRKFLDPKNLVENDNASAQNARRAPR